MARQLTWLSDAEWAKIEPLLSRGRSGAHRVDDRRVISGIVHMLRIGAPWRTCPPEYGPYTTIYNRFHRWSRQGGIVKQNAPGDKAMSGMAGECPARESQPVRFAVSTPRRR